MVDIWFVDAFSLRKAHLDEEKVGRMAAGKGQVISSGHAVVVVGVCVANKYLTRSMTCRSRIRPKWSAEDPSLILSKEISCILVYNPNHVQLMCTLS